MGHEHVHMSPETKDKRVAVAIWANGILTLVQIAERTLPAAWR